MLIQPDTNIKILSGCPLDNRYEHTIYFDTAQEQLSYFSSLAKYNLTKQSYQRYEKGWLTVQVTAEDLYDCNYLMFQNASFGTKWFYAFITSVEYVNNVTSRIQYQIDIMQTWHFNYTLGQCFVAREHTVTDNIGDNLVHEEINFGPYVYEGMKHPETDNGLSMEDLSVIIMYNPGLIDIVGSMPEAEPFLYKANFYSGVYQGVNFLAIPVNENNISLLDDLLGSTDFLTGGGIMSCFIMPTMFLPQNKSGFNDYNTDVYMYVNRNTSFGGYEPKNNKLFTYPYTCAYLTSNRGKGNEFAFEYFLEDGKALFYAEGNLCSNPSVICFPFGYKGVSQYIEGAVSIPSYPICTWGSDGVTEWINNNLFKGLINLSGTAISGLVSPASALPKIAQDATLQAVGLAQSFAEPGKAHGGVEGDILMGNINGRHIFGMVQRITPHYARIVDEYFTRFGYATNLVKVPNRTTRPHWNYVKTAGCSATGSVPSDDMSAICNIYDRGITFWKSGANIGNYSLDNSPVENEV